MGVVGLSERSTRLEVEVLPALSRANVREMLQAVMRLPQLSPEQATRLVVKHLINRSRSTRSRLKAQRRNRGPTQSNIVKVSEHSENQTD